MLARIFLAVLLLLAGPSVSAQSLTLTGVGPGGSGASYAGPIDIVASPAALYYLRAGSSAIATTGTQSIVDLRRPSDNATCTAPIAATGGALDLTVKPSCNSNTQTVAAWTNNASSVTATIATTVLTVSACSACNLAAGLPITGAGVAAGTVIVSLGTGTGGIGTYNVNISQTESVGETMTAPGYAAVSKWYDQSGNGSDAVQATAGNQCKLVYSGGPGTSPAIFCSRAATQTLVATISNLSQPFSILAIGAPNNVVTSQYNLGGTYNVASGVELGVNQSSSNYYGYAGNFASFSTATVAWHAIQAVYSGVTSTLYVDGSGSGSLNAGTNASSTAFTIGSVPSAGGNHWDGGIAGIGIYPVSIAASNAALNSNMHAIGGGW